jgi:hypothetical protein
VKTDKFNNAKNIHVNISELPNGIYLLNIKSDLGLATLRIIKE